MSHENPHPCMYVYTAEFTTLYVHLIWIFYCETVTIGVLVVKRLGMMPDKLRSEYLRLASF